MNIYYIMPATTRSQTKNKEQKYWKEQQRIAKQTIRARKEITEFFSANKVNLSREERGEKDLYVLSKNKQFFRDIYN